MDKNLWEVVKKVRTSHPLVLNITNFVVMNNTANALLAAGASPIMAHAFSEIDELVALCNALVINIGTLDELRVASMLQAAKKASEYRKPWILDPVGAGASSYRDAVLAQLLQWQPSVIRGNASEILALAQLHTQKTKGVDSSAASLEAIEAAQYLHQQHKALVCISGVTDYIVGNDTIQAIANGNPLMTRVTGLGCSATAVIAAFTAVEPDHGKAVTAAVAYFSICGERAAQKAKGPGSLQMEILDELHLLSQSEFESTIKWSTL